MKIREKRPVTIFRERGRNGVIFMGGKCHPREYFRESSNTKGDLRGDLQVDDRVGRQQVHVIAVARVTIFYPTSLYY